MLEEFKTRLKYDKLFSFMIGEDRITIFKSDYE
jgi:hypothetical protein